MHRIAAFCKRDRTYVPRNSPHSSRWHAVIDGHDFELLFTGERFWDGRAGTGGGGAVDFVMHTRGLGFLAATEVLRELGI